MLDFLESYPRKALFQEAGMNYDSLAFLLQQFSPEGVRHARPTWGSNA